MILSYILCRKPPDQVCNNYSTHPISMPSLAQITSMLCSSLCITTCIRLAHLTPSLSVHSYEKRGDKTRFVMQAFWWHCVYLTVQFDSSLMDSSCVVLHKTMLKRCPTSIVWSKTIPFSAFIYEWITLSITLVQAASELRRIRTVQRMEQ